jgi:dihydropteroate synthase
MNAWFAGDRCLADPGAPRIMGIVNVTPDSFSDGGAHATTQAAIAHALELVEAGADILDIGGESTRPGAAPVTLDDERRRVLPVLEALRQRTSVPLSLDTSKPALAREALALGVEIMNDIAGLRDPAMIEAVAGSQAAVVIMHMQGTPQTMQDDPRYDDVVAEVSAWLACQVAAAEAAGIARRRIAVDPGIGFGKRSAHNQALLRNLHQFQTLGCAILVGTSRKRFLGSLTGRPINDRVAGTIASCLAAVARGASVVRVHDVAAVADALKVWQALMGPEES